MNIEDKYKELLERFKADAHGILEESIGEIHSGFMPYIENDTVYNVEYQVKEVVSNLIAGQFKDAEDGVIVHGREGLSCTIKMTAHQYDHVRKALIEAMPECPKDLEIKSLKEQIKNLKNDYRAW